MFKSIKQWCAGWPALAHDSQGEHLFPTLCSMTSYLWLEIGHGESICKTKISKCTEIFKKMFIKHLPVYYSVKDS